MKRLAVPLVFALAIAACSSGDDAGVASLEDTSDTPTSTAATPEIDAEQAALEFAQCMRDNGVANYPDPELDSNGNLQLFGGGGGPGDLGADQNTLQAAFEECSPLVEGMIQNTFQDSDPSEFQDNFLEFAKCMRDNGVDMPDPDFSQGFGPGAGGGPGGLFGDIDPQDPAFQDAAEQCQSIFEGSFGPGGRGPFGGGGPGEDSDSG